MRIPRRGPSSRLRRKVCEAAEAGSFEKASRLLRRLAGLEVSAKRAQLLTESVGAVLATERDRQTRAFLERRPPETSEAPDLLVVSADGGRVQTRQDDPSRKWKEDKVGVVYDATPHPEEPGKPYQGAPPGTRSVTATLASWDELGDFLGDVADRRGYRRAQTKIFVSDGASALRTLRERAFPDAVFVLDWAHAVEHLHASSRAGLGDGDEADRWYERQKERLWNGRVDLVLKHLRSLAGALGPPPDEAPEADPRRVLARDVQYFRDNAAGMDYARFRREGWPIGSGIIESVVKQIGMRVKGSEKHWSLPGVEETLQVVTALISQDGAWDRFWRRAPIAA